MSTGVAADAALVALREIFVSRLEALGEFLAKGEAFFGNESFLDRRLAPDMLPLGTQIAFTCDQARNFGLFCQGRSSRHFDGNITTMTQARTVLREAQATMQAPGGDDSRLGETRRVALGNEFYCELTGARFVHDFLLPNFYFHLVTAYDILRMAGVNLGKQDFMRHLGPHMRKA